MSKILTITTLLITQGLLVACSGYPKPVDPSELVLTAVFYPPIFVEEGYYAFPAGINFRSADGGERNVTLDDYSFSVSGDGGETIIRLDRQIFHESNDEYAYPAAIDVFSCADPSDCSTIPDVSDLSFSLSITYAYWSRYNTVSAVSDTGLNLLAPAIVYADDKNIEVQWSNFGVADLVEFWSMTECGESVSTALNVVSSSEDTGMHNIPVSSFLPESRNFNDDCEVTLVAYRIVAGEIGSESEFHDAVISYVSAYEQIQFTVLASEDPS